MHAGQRPARASRVSRRLLSQTTSKHCERRSRRVTHGGGWSAVRILQGQHRKSGWDDADDVQSVLAPSCGRTCCVVTANQLQVHSRSRSPRGLKGQLCVTPRLFIQLEGRSHNRGTCQTVTWSREVGTQTGERWHCGDCVCYLPCVFKHEDEKKKWKQNI